jgi:protein SCO1/2
VNRSRVVRLAAGAVAVLAVVGLVAVLYATRQGDDDTRTAGRDGGDGGGQSDQADDGDGGWHGALVTDPAPRPEFTLTDTAGRPYDFAQETAGRLTLLFFGYTSCPDVCPVHMATLAAALERPGVPQPVVVFVTTDPARDTPDHLRDWLDNFDGDFVGLTGTQDQIQQAEAAAMVEPSLTVDTDGVALEAPPTDGQDYEIGHAAQIIAYTSDDLTHIVYPFGIQRDDWTADLPRLADGWPAAS